MHRPMLHVCARDNCRTLTMGEFCLEHEPPVVKAFQRGRPYPPLKRATRERIRTAA